MNSSAYNSSGQPTRILSVLDKFAIANELRDIAMLMELKKENPYKARAYAIGAAALEGINEDLGRLIEDGRLTTIRGIGESLASQIEEIYSTGSSKLLESLRKEMPAGVIELSQIPGLSIKKIQALHDELAISSIKELEDACRAGKVARVKGFGKKTEENILAGIKEYENREEAELLVDVLDTAARIRYYMAGTKGLVELETAGELRRWCETIHRMEFVAATTNSTALFAKLAKFPLVTKSEILDASRSQVRLSDGMRVQVRTVDPTKENFHCAWLLETASAGHIEKLHAIAEQQGMELTAGGLRHKRGYLPVETEADIYRHLGLPYIPPEMRENAGEIEQALDGKNFDDLIQVEHILGMTHCHTTYSDGRHSVLDMARAAELMGMHYITITDHSPTAHYAGGVTTDALKRQWEEIDEAQEQVDIKIFRGTESDILADGALDYPDHILDQFDVIIASIHSRMKMDENEMTRRLVNCMKRRQFKIWGHPLGRLVLRRPPIACQMDKVLDAICESRVAIEINGDPYRLDMAPEWSRLARQRGIKFVISVDAHSTGALNYLNYGIHLARRGGLRKDEVLNTLSAQDFAAVVKPA